MVNYTFTQQIDYPDILTGQIQSSNISPPMSYIETSGNGPSMSVLIWFTDTLSDQDITTLNSIMANYVNTIPAEQVIFNKIKKDMTFGLSVIAQFGAGNRSAGLTTTQVIQVLQILAPIQSLLISGSIETALISIQNITPNAIITQDIINYYTTLLQNYLNESSNG